jgi:predicted CxxxxCH...CXXCH cytochrome family protein
MPGHRSITLPLAAVLVGLAACSQARQVEGNASSTPCTRCHGGAADVTGAPPRGVLGESATTEIAVGAHSAHVQAGSLAAAIACTACHPDPRYGSTEHGNGLRDVEFGGLATTGLAAPPVWDRGAATCSGTYCHGATLAGGANPAPTWTRVGQGEAACGACHGLPPPGPHPAVAGGLTACHLCHETTVDEDGGIVPAAGGGVHLDGQIQVAGVHEESWTDAASEAFHAYSANQGLSSCQPCHGPDLGGGFSGVACAGCHAAGGPAPAFGCTGCHGGTEDLTGAPPRATWGNGGDPVRVGAHAVHLGGEGIAPAFDCDACHQKPATIFTPGHVDPSPAEVAFGGLAIADGATPAPWDRATATCSSTYCHGGTLAGGMNTAPLWTGGAGEAACGSCHGLPPPSPHPEVTGGLETCGVCHPQTVDAGGAIVPPSAGGLHLDGSVEWSGGHDAEWMDPSGAGFHAPAANQGLSPCQLCHGQGLDGVGGVTTVACADCHAGSFAPVLDCTGCHGGVDNATGAPPRPQWAFRGDATEAALRNGAHTAHLSGSDIAPAFDCDVCHEKPASMFSAGHIGSGTTADVFFGGLAVNGMTAPPVWDRAVPTCAVYCHGTTLPGGSLTAPDWTAVGQGQADCGTCHGIPPTDPHPAVSADLAGCHDCHPKTIDAAGAMIPPASGGKHLNGLIDGGHLPSWSDPASSEFHAYSANRGLSSCQLCHGQALEGLGDAPACADCHAAGGTAPALTCTGCHGGLDDQTGAPPKATWGNRTDAVRIGAHTSHVGTNPVSSPMPCAECHATPGSMFSAGHLDPPRAEVAFQGPVSGIAGGTWNYPISGAPTCSSTYCHGNFTRGNTTNTPDWTGTGQAACGTCHDARPVAYLHNKHERQYDGDPEWWPAPGESTWITCDQCHFGIARSVDRTTPPELVVTDGSGPPLHVNGDTTVVFKLGGTYTKGAFSGSCSGMYCHPGETKEWPR